MCVDVFIAQWPLCSINEMRPAKDTDNCYCGSNSRSWAALKWPSDDTEFKFVLPASSSWLELTLFLTCLSMYPCTGICAHCVKLLWCNLLHFVRPQQDFPTTTKKIILSSWIVRFKLQLLNYVYFKIWTTRVTNGKKTHDFLSYIYLVLQQ